MLFKKKIYQNQIWNIEITKWHVNIKYSSAFFFLFLFFCRVSFLFSYQNRASSMPCGTSLRGAKITETFWILGSFIGYETFIYVWFVHQTQLQSPDTPGSDSFIFTQREKFTHCSGGFLYNIYLPPVPTTKKYLSPIYKNVFLYSC